MRRLAWLFFLPLALCQYQQQQRYNPQQFQNPQQQQYGANQQYNNQQQQQYSQNQQNQQMQNRPQQNQQNARYPQQQYPQQGYQQQSGQYNQQQQYGQNQQGMNGHMNPNQQQSSRSEVVNTPTRLMSSSGNLDTTSLTYGAQVDIKLNSYSNTDLSLSNKTTCSCPNGRYCDYLSADKQNSCQFSFTTVISAKDQSVQFIQSDFYPFSGSINTGNWTMAMSFVMPTKPVAVDIFVQHLGVVINKLSGQLEYFNHLTLVDSFVVDMTAYLPTQNQNSRQYTLTGLVQKTSLQMALSVQCINGMMGTDCDLRCDSTTNNQFDNVICTDSYGANSSCRWNTYKTSVTDCVVCNMVGANGTCAVVYNERHDGVSHAFRTWTIVLGCLLGLAVLVILCLIISFIICYRFRNRTHRDETTSTAYKAPVQDSYANGKSSHQPLLDDEWAAPRRPIMPERTNDRGYNARETNTSVSRQEHQV